MVSTWETPGEHIGDLGKHMGSLHRMHRGRTCGTPGPHLGQIVRFELEEYAKCGYSTLWQEPPKSYPMLAHKVVSFCFIQHLSTFIFWDRINLDTCPPNIFSFYIVNPYLRFYTLSMHSVDRYSRLCWHAGMTESQKTIHSKLGSLVCSDAFFVLLVFVREAAAVREGAAHYRF